MTNTAIESSQCKDESPYTFHRMMLTPYLTVALMLVRVAELFDPTNQVLDGHFQDQCTQRCPFQVSNVLLFIKDVLESTTVLVAYYCTIEMHARELQRQWSREKQYT